VAHDEVILPVHVCWLRGGLGGGDGRLRLCVRRAASFAVSGGSGRHRDVIVWGAGRSDRSDHLGLSFPGFVRFVFGVEKRRRRKEGSAALPQSLEVCAKSCLSFDIYCQTTYRQRFGCRSVLKERFFFYLKERQFFRTVGQTRRTVLQGRIMFLPSFIFLSHLRS